MHSNPSNIYIYGAGTEYNKLSSYINIHNNKFHVMGLVTTEKSEYSQIDGYPCITCDEADFSCADYVIIAVANWKEISEILLEHGVNREKIIRSSVFSLPNFCWEDYLRLKNSNVSIICNTCLGGIIYSELGLEFLSPTVNTGILYDGFLDLLEDYRYYLTKDMVPKGLDIIGLDGTANSMERESFYPKGRIYKGDNYVEVMFPHTDDIISEVAKWNERRTRVNNENIAAIMVIKNDEEAYRFSDLPIEKKIGVYYKDLRINSVIYCSHWESQTTRIQYDYNWFKYGNAYMCNSRGMSSAVDWIKFLNGDSGAIRYAIEQS